MPTIRKNRTQLAALCLTTVLAGATQGQFSERIEVRLHQLDVIVETRDGKPVTDLTKDDFIVTKDRKQQEITNFSVFVDSAIAGVRNTPASSEAPPRERRRFIFFIDQVSMYPPTRDIFLTRVSEVLGVMGNGDEGMVVTPASIEEKIPLYLTGDKQLLMRTLIKVTRDMMFRTDNTPLQDPWEPKLPLAIDIGPPLEPETIKRIDDCGQSLEVCSQKRLKSLKSIIRTAERLPGKKILVLMTTRMSSVPGMVLSQAKPQAAVGTSNIAMQRRSAIVNEFKTLEPLVDEVGRDAAASNVTIYGIEPFEYGLSSMPGVTAERRDMTRTYFDGENGTQDTLQSLAAQTGGKAFRGSGDIPSMLDQITRDLSVYYSLGFREIPGKKSDFHNVQVRIRNRNDLVVRTRRTVSSDTPEQESAEEVTAALLTTDPQNALGIGVTLSPLVPAGKTVDVPLRITIPIGKLTFLKDGEKQKAALNVRLAAVSGSGTEFRAAGEQRVEVVFTPAELAAAQKSDYVYDMHLHVPPGKYRIAVRVADTLSNEKGFRTLNVTVQ